MSGLVLKKASSRSYLPRIKVRTLAPSFYLGDLSPVDVVSVNPDTVDQWEYPPYSGHYDGVWPSCFRVVI